MSDFALPDNVKEVISRMPVKDQVVLRAYIAGLRDQLKEYKVQAEKPDDDDPHAHYHGHEKCTSDHGHGDHDHKEHDHKEHDHKEHDHKEHDHMACDGHNGHGHHDHKEHDHKEHDHMACDGHHEHEHHDHEHLKSHEHGHHEHGHAKKNNEEEVPAWKKRALESGADPSAAPFGGSWAAESSVDATK